MPWFKYKAALTAYVLGDKKKKKYRFFSHKT